MSFSNNPVFSTYDTKTVPLAVPLDIRPNSDFFIPSGPTGLSQGSGLVNLLPYPDLDDPKSHTVVTRPSMNCGIVTGASNPLTEVLGMYVWEKDSTHIYYYIALDGLVYSSSTGASGTWNVTSITSGTVNGMIGFTEFLTDTGTKSLIMATGVACYQWTDATTITNLTTNIHTALTGNFLPTPIYMDGYLFLAEISTGDIYNSNLNAPGTWTAGSFISSELYPDDLTALVKINNYILAVGTQGCEYFYDAANPTASPLARLEGQSLPFGTLFPRTIAHSKNAVVMVANTNDGGVVIRTIEDLKFKDIDTTTLLPLLNTRLSSYFSTGTISALLKAYFLRLNGDLYYVLSFDPAATTRQQPTVAFSFNSGIWVEFTYNTSAPLPITCSCSPLAVSNGSTYIAGQNPSTLKPFFGTFSEGSYPSTNVQIASDYLDASTAVPIYQEIRTGNLDFSILNRKMMNRIGLYGVANNKAAVQADSDYSISVSWSDDDYQTYSTVRTLSLKPGTNFPFLTQLGEFRQRTFKLTYSGRLFWNFDKLEVTFNKGQR